MKFSILLKYIIMFCILLLLTSTILCVYSYFELGNKDLKIIYLIIVPLYLFIITFLYARKIKNNGWIRGVEIWAAYLIIINIMKYLMSIEIMGDIYKYLLYLPVCLIGGILGVNTK